jgi:hypothetical protein
MYVEVSFFDLPTRKFQSFDRYSARDDRHEAQFKIYDSCISLNELLSGLV